MTNHEPKSADTLTRLEEPHLSQLAAAVYRQQAAEAEERAAELQLALARRQREDATAKCDVLVAKLAAEHGLDLKRQQINLESGQIITGTRTSEP